MSARPDFERVAVIGLGLLGGSVAAAVRARGLADEVVGISRRAENAERAVELGMVDRATTDLAEGVGGIDLVVLATPVFAMERVVREAAPHLAEGTLVTDVGSVKGSLADTLPGLLPPGVRFTGSHPMAGSHATGLAHARADLFEGAACVVTPGADPGDTGRLGAFWQALGMRVELRAPDRHDEEVAWISHLPHAVAFAFARALERAPESAASLRGSGFRDFTRVARSDPDMWADILVTNRKALAGPLHEMSTRLAELARLLEADDPDGVTSYLTRARDELEPGAPSANPTGGDDASGDSLSAGGDRVASGDALSAGGDSGGGARSGGDNPEIQAAQEAATKE